MKAPGALPSRGLVRWRRRVGTMLRYVQCPDGQMAPRTCQVLLMTLLTVFGMGGGVEWVHYHLHPKTPQVLGVELSLPPPTCSWDRWPPREPVSGPGVPLDPPLSGHDTSCPSWLDGEASLLQSRPGGGRLWEGTLGSGGVRTRTSEATVCSPLRVTQALP